MRGWVRGGVESPDFLKARESAHGREAGGVDLGLGKIERFQLRQWRELREAYGRDDGAREVEAGEVFPGGDGGEAGVGDFRAGEFGFDDEVGVRGELGEGLVVAAGRGAGGAEDQAVGDDAGARDEADAELVGELRGFGQARGVVGGDGGTTMAAGVSA